MPEQRCKATTKKKTRCKNLSMKGKEYCHVHIEKSVGQSNLALGPTPVPRATLKDRQKAAVMARTDGRCYMCWNPHGVHIEHIVPFTNRPDLDSMKNMLMACPTCNLRKGVSSLVDYVKTTPGALKEPDKLMEIVTRPCFSMHQDTIECVRRSVELAKRGNRAYLKACKDKI